MKKLLPGFIPLIILIIAGIVIAGAGGTYIVRKQFVKKGQSGKAALDEKKISEQLKNPVPLESPSPEPTPQLAPVQYNYEPEKTSGDQTGRFYEFTADTEYSVEHVIIYFTIKNNCLVQASGHALDSAWSNRVGVLKASIGSLRFTD